MFRRDPQPGPAIRKLCEPLAAAHGVHYDFVTLEGPRIASEWAFSFVRFGASLILALAERDGYPGANPKARRRGAEAVARTFGTEAACRATVFMGHALFDHTAAVQEAHGHLTSADAYRSVRGLLDEYYPLSASEKDRLEECSTELEHLAEGTAPIMHLNGFHVAASRGEDPRDDPDLVAIQQRTVGEFFRRTAAAHAIELCVGHATFEKLSDTFLWPTLLSVESLPYSAGELVVWASVSGRFTDAVSEFLDALPSSS
jgi:hypothetical protein